MTIQVKPLFSFVDRILGLIPPKNLPPVLIFTRFGIHTFFMKYPIDVLILSSRGQVAKIACSLKPNKIFFYNPLYYQVVELAGGYVNTHKIKIGDKIKIKYKT